jgi:bla regulator protein blaR1
VVAKNGPKLQASKPDQPAADGSEQHGNHMLRMHGRGHLESTGADIHGLTRILATLLGRTVIDKTGLTGNFDYKLDWTPDDAMQAAAKGGDAIAGASAASADNAGPSLFTALEEQLGLRLEAAKGPADVVVIDQLEQPSEN